MKPPRKRLTRLTTQAALNHREGKRPTKKSQELAPKPTQTLSHHRADNNKDKEDFQPCNKVTNITSIEVKNLDVDEGTENPC